MPWKLGSPSLTLPNFKIGYLRGLVTCSCNCSWVACVHIYIYIYIKKNPFSIITYTSPQSFLCPINGKLTLPKMKKEKKNREKLLKKKSKEINLSRYSKQPKSGMTINDHETSWDAHISRGFLHQRAQLNSSWDTHISRGFCTKGHN